MAAINVGEIEALFRIRDEFSATFNKFQKQLDDVKKSVDDAGKAHERLGQSTAGTLENIEKVGLAMTTVVIAGRELREQIGEIVKAQSEQEDSTARLSAALKSQGTFTPQLVENYQELGDELQATTVFSANLTKEMEALLVQIGGVMPAQMDEAIKATADLAAGLRVDLRTATLLVGKAFAGETDTLKRYGIIIDDAAFKTKGAQVVLDAISQRMGGQAAAQAKTFTGEMARLGNVVDDVRATFGNVIASGIGPFVEAFIAAPPIVRDTTIALGLLTVSVVATGAAMIGLNTASKLVAKAIGVELAAEAGIGTLALKGMAVAIGTLSEAAIFLTTTPLGIFITAMATLAAAIVYVQRTTDTTLPKIKGFGDNADDAHDGVDHLTKSIIDANDELLKMKQHIDGLNKLKDIKLIDVGGGVEGQAPDVDKIRQSEAALKAHADAIEDNKKTADANAAAMANLSTSIAFNVNAANSDAEAMKHLGDASVDAMFRVKAIEDELTDAVRKSIEEHQKLIDLQEHLFGLDVIKRARDMIDVLGRVPTKLPAVGGASSSKPATAPSLVPTLTEEEVKSVLAAAAKQQSVSPVVEQKAEAFALQRQDAGKPLFAQAGEQSDKFPSIARAPLPTGYAEAVRDATKAFGDLSHAQQTAARTQETVAATATKNGSVLDNVSKLTVDAQAEVNKTVNDAINAYKALGKEVPPILKQIADATANAAEDKRLADQFNEIEKSLSRAVPAIHGTVSALAGMDATSADQIALDVALERFGDAAVEAVADATNYGASIDAMSTTAKLATARMEQLATQMERVSSTAVPQLDTTPGFGDKSDKDLADLQKFFDSRDAMITESQKRAADAATTAAEIALEHDKAIGASRAKLAADQEAIERARTNAQIVDENRRFELETATIDKESDLYKQLEAAHQQAVDGIVDSWATGVAERKAAELTFSEEVERNLKQLAGRITDIIENAFTGAGGLKGALKAIAIELAEAFIKPFIDAIIKRITAARLGKQIADATMAGAAGGFAFGGGGGGGGGIGSTIAQTGLDAALKKAGVSNPLTKLLGFGGAGGGVPNTIAPGVIASSAADAGALVAPPAFLAGAPALGSTEAGVIAGSSAPPAAASGGLGSLLSPLAGPAAGFGVGFGVGEATGSKTKGALSGAAAGAGVGFLFGGPIGAGIGAAVGFVSGIVGGFLGGQREHKKVNDLRDAFQLQFGKPGTGPGSGFAHLADLLHHVPNGDSVFKELQSAKKTGDFERAERDVMAALEQLPVKTDKKLFDQLGHLKIRTVEDIAAQQQRIQGQADRANRIEKARGFSTGGFVPPGAEWDAVVHGGAQGEVIIPVAKVPPEMMDAFSQIVASIGGPASTSPIATTAAAAGAFGSAAKATRSAIGGLFGFGGHGNTNGVFASISEAFKKKLQPAAPPPTLPPSPIDPTTAIDDSIGGGTDATQAAVQAISAAKPSGGLIGGLFGGLFGGRSASIPPLTIAGPKDQMKLGLLDNVAQGDFGRPLTAQESSIAAIGQALFHGKGSVGGPARAIGGGLFGGLFGKKPRSFEMGGDVPPGVVWPALLHGGRFGEKITPNTKADADPQPNITTNHVTFQISTPDAASFDRIWQTQIVPRLHMELVTNQLGTVTKIQKIQKRRAA